MRRLYLALCVVALLAGSAFAADPDGSGHGITLNVNPTSLTITAGSSATAALTPSNYDGEVSYSASVSWVTFSGNTATFSPTTAGTYTVTITASNLGSAATVDVSVTVNAAPADPDPLSLSASTSSLTINLPNTGTVSLTPSNAQGSVSYTASESWVTFSGNTATFSPTTAGTYSVTITASDSWGQSASVTVSVTVNAALTLAADPASLTLTSGTTSAVSLTPSNAQGSVSYTANQSWVTFSGNTATFAPTTAGTYTVTITATDSLGRTATANVSVTVNAPLSLSASPSELTITAGSSASTALTTTNASGTVSYSASESWVTFSGNTATFAPTTAGDYSVTITASDGSGRTATASVSVTVSAPPLPVLSLSASPSAITLTAGRTASATLTTTNAQGTVSYTASASWAVISGNTVTFTPTLAGTYTITITATDSGRTTNNTATASVSVIVLAPLALTVSPTALTITAGRTAAASLTPANAQGTVNYTASVSWAVFSGNTVTFSPTSAGTYTVTITARDTQSQTATATVTVTVSPAAPVSGDISPSSGDITPIVSPDISQVSPDTPIGFVEPTTPSTPGDTTNPDNTSGNYTEPEPVLQGNTVRPNTQALRQIVLNQETSAKIAAIFPNAGNKQVFSLVGNSNITMDSNPRAINNAFQEHLRQTGEEVMLAFPTIRASAAGIYVLGVSLKDVAEGGTLIDSVSTITPSTSGAVHSAVRQAADIEAINLLDQAGNPVELKRATNGLSYAVVPSNQNMLVAVEMEAGESWMGSLTKPSQLPTIAVETVTIEQLADIAQERDEQAQTETREETVNRITDNLVNAVTELISRPDVIENIINNNIISRDILSRDITSADIKTLTSRDVVTDAEEPTQEMEQAVQDDGYELAAKLNMIQVQESGIYVFKVTLSEQSFTELRGMSVNDVKVYALSDTEFEIRPSFLSGLLSTFELLTMNGERMDSIGFREFLMIGLLESSKPLSLYLAKILIMLLLGGCNHGLGIAAVFVVAGVFIRRARKHK